MKDLDRVVMKNGYILVQQEGKKETRTESGLILPVQKGDMKNKYTVVAMDSTITEVSIGDEVVIDRFAGSKQIIDDQEYFVAKSEDIVLVFREQVTVRASIPPLNVGSK